MKTFRLSLKLYSTFHTDLLVLKECDVAFAALVKLALYYRVRGRKLNIFVPECREYRYLYKCAFIKEVITIDDEVTILFLTTMIREKRRMAFVRSVLYDSLICPPCGDFFKDSRLISLENERLGGMDLSEYNDVLICRQGAENRRNKPQLLRPTLEIPEWIPRDWFTDPQPAENADTASPLESEGGESPSFTDEAASGQQERPRRKKKRKKKRRKAPEPAPSAPLQDGDGSCHDTHSDLHDAGDTEDTGVPGAGISSDSSVPKEDFFPMLEEEEF